MTSQLTAATLGLHLLAVLTAAPLAAQTPYRVTRTPSELLTAYVREYQIPRANFSSSAFHDLIRILGHPSDYAAADIETLQAGLEHLALTGHPPRLRAESVLLLGFPGSYRVAQPRPQTYSHLTRIYLGSQDPLVRMMVINAVGDLAARSRAAAFLERVAARDPLRYVTEPDAAISSLLMMGEEGLAVLKRLHETGAVQHAEARYRLAVLARLGYLSKSKAGCTEVLRGINDAGSRAPRQLPDVGVSESGRFLPFPNR